MIVGWNSLNGILADSGRYWIDDSVRFYGRWKFERHLRILFDSPVRTYLGRVPVATGRATCLQLFEYNNIAAWHTSLLSEIAVEQLRRSIFHPMGGNLNVT